MAEWNAHEPPQLWSWVKHFSDIFHYSIWRIHSFASTKSCFTGKYYGSDNEGEGPSVSSVVRDHLQRMTEVMNASVTSRTMVDVETADKVNVSPHHYSCIAFPNCRTPQIWNYLKLTYHSLPSMVISPTLNTSYYHIFQLVDNNALFGKECF